jgi:hypothetical protein
VFYLVEPNRRQFIIVVKQHALRLLGFTRTRWHYLCDVLCTSLSLWRSVALPACRQTLSSPGGGSSTHKQHLVAALKVLRQQQLEQLNPEQKLPQEGQHAQPAVAACSSSSSSSSNSSCSNNVKQLRQAKDKAAAAAAAALEDVLLLVR